MKRVRYVLLSVLVLAVLGVLATQWVLAGGDTPAEVARTASYQAGWRPGVYVIHGGYTGLLPEGNEVFSTPYGEIRATTFPIAGNLRGFNWGHPLQPDSVVIDPNTGERV